MLLTNCGEEIVSQAAKRMGIANVTVAQWIRRDWLVPLRKDDILGYVLSVAGPNGPTTPQFLSPQPPQPAGQQLTLDHQPQHHLQAGHSPVQF